MTAFLGELCRAAIAGGRREWRRRVPSPPPGRPLGGQRHCDNTFELNFVDIQNIGVIFVFVSIVRLWGGTGGPTGGRGVGSDGPVGPRPGG